jgi:hypothetical protein
VPDDALPPIGQKLVAELRYEGKHPEKAVGGRL